MSDFTVMLRNAGARAYFALRAIPVRWWRTLDHLHRGIYVARGSMIESGTKIGRRTRINAVSHIGRCEIGNYCAIGGRLVVRSANHSTGYANMQGFAQSHFLHAVTSVTGVEKGIVRVGHGVWIGDSVLILPGVQIGNGAVIGAGSVVTKPIPAFAIAVGNPARVIRMRFTPAVCAELETLAWWNWDDKRIAQNRRFFEIDLGAMSEGVALDRLKEFAQ